MLALALVGSCAPALPAAAAPSHEGRWITDERGRVVVLHGFNMVAKVAPYTAQSVGFGDDDAEFLAANGFNVVRLGFQWKALEPRPGSYDDRYLDQVADTVDVLARHGIYTLLDFHQDGYNEAVGGQGFPDWTVDATVGGIPAPNAGPTILNPANYAAWDNFWANGTAPDGARLWDRFALMWRHVARRFRDSPWVIGYDLMNEPIPGTTIPLCLNPVACPFDETLGRFYRYVIPRVRDVDRAHLVWYEPNIVAGAGGAQDIDHGDDQGAVLSFHNYCVITALTSGGFEEPRQGACPVSEQLTFDNAERQAARNDDALVMTEFGSTPRLDEVERVAAGADERRVGWTEWTYHNTGHTNFAGQYSVVLDPRKPPTGGNVDAGLLKTMSRPYPRVIAGTPGRWAFDARHRIFELVYTTRRVGSERAVGDCERTQVFVPAHAFGGSYGVEADGAEVVSPPGARLLELVSRPGNDTVRLRVTSSGRAPARTSRCDPRLRLKLRPRPVKAGRRVRFSFEVRAAGRPVKGARVRALGRRALTNSRGRAKLTVRVGRPGRYRVSVTKPLHRTARSTLRVRR